MPVLFDRKASVLVTPVSGEGGETRTVVDFGSMRTAFLVEQTLKSKPANNAKVTVWNLSAASSSKLKKPGSLIEVHAGYDGDVGLLYRGDIKTGYDAFEGVDKQTIVTSGDGDMAMDQARVTISAGPNTKMGDVIRQALGSMSFRQLGQDLTRTIKEYLAETAERTERGGRTFQGAAARIMDELGKKFQFNWSFQDGEVLILPENKVTNAPVVVMSASTGMIGSPELVANSDPKARRKVRVRSRLNHRLKPGRAMEIPETKVKEAIGNWKIVKSQHQGDTERDIWRSITEAVEI